MTYDGQISVVDAKGLRASKVITNYQTEARVFANEYRLQFGREAINDAVQVWFDCKRDGRVDVIREQFREPATFDWIELVRRCFDCSEMSAEFIAAILQKYIHQARRKLDGLTVTSHLMPVILGRQGSGKSWFMKWLTDPVAELRRDTDFKAIGDERNIGLWSSYALIVDEMAYADKSDIETVKHVITADVLDRRPMRRNESVRVPQCATLIGASNKSLGELIRDETGIRRFAGIHFRNDADWEYLNAQSALDAWRSVSPDAPDPLDEFREELAALQVAERHVSPVEAWLTSLRGVDTHGILPEREPPTAETLYQTYLSHFHSRNDGHRPKTMAAWEQEVGRLLKDGTYAVEKYREKGRVKWRWRKPAGEAYS